MSKYRSELRIPVQRDRSNKSVDLFDDFDKWSSWSDFDRSPRTILDREPRQIPWSRRLRTISTNRLRSSDDWYADVQRRFDEQRRKMDEDMKRIEPNPGLSGLSRSRDNFSSGFERATGGGVQFMAQFELTGYDPDSVKVCVKNQQLHVSAKTEDRSSTSRINREYMRSINLPIGAEDDKLSAVLSLDGILSVSCPMKPPPFSSTQIPLNENNQSRVSDDVGFHSLRPFNRSYRLNNSREPTMSQSSHSLLSHHDDNFIKKHRRPRFRLELPIDNIYTPGEIQIKTLNNRIYVNARHEDRGSSRTAVREFSKEYDIPDSVNPESLAATFDDGILCIEELS